jgi:hypothetical protein
MNYQWFCEIRDEFGDVESAGHVLTGSEAFRWYRDREIDFSQVTLTEFGFTFTRAKS